MTVRILIDDVRTFKDHRECKTARTPETGIKALLAHQEQIIDELWLDYNLSMRARGADPTIMPVIDHLVQVAHDGNPYNITTIFVHTDNPVAGQKMEKALIESGYSVVVHWESSFEPVWGFTPRNLLVDDYL